MTPTAPNGTFYRLNSKAFIRGMPSLFAGKQRLHAVFTSYNDIGGFADGPVPNCPCGLSVKIVRGNFDGGGKLLWQLFGSLITDDLGEMKSAMDNMHAEGGGEYKAAANVALSDVGDVDDSLIFAYMGVSAQKECLDFVVAAKKASPRSTIVVLMCDCFMQEKTASLKQHVPDGVISYLVETGECGGRLTMGEIARALIEQWPKRELALVK